MFSRAWKSVSSKNESIKSFYTQYKWVPYLLQ